MFLSALLQYGSADDTFSSNIRYRWEYIPGSEFFLVWTDEHDTRPNGTGLRNRAFVDEGDPVAEVQVRGFSVLRFSCYFVLKNALSCEPSRAVIVTR